MNQYIKHVVGAPMHHGGHRGGRGFGFFPYPVYDYPVYVTCPPGWGYDAQTGQCQPLEQHKVGQTTTEFGQHPRYQFVGQTMVSTSPVSYDPVTGQPYGADAPTGMPGQQGASATGQGTAIVPPQVPSGGLFGGVERGATNLGQGISNAAWIFGGFLLAIVGVVAYTAYKTDAPRHAAEFGRASLAHADESTKLAARLVT